MLESSYNLLFGKLALKSLFEDYFDAANHFSTIFMLKPIEDRHVDLVATVSTNIFCQVSVYLYIYDYTIYLFIYVLTFVYWDRH